MTSPEDKPDVAEHPGPKPSPPRPEHCCNTACDPCIWTYHHRALAKWEERATLWKAAGGELSQG